jgi:hypothetical protein
MVRRKKQKAQMLIITMIFLIGFIFAVQQNLLQYSQVNAPESMRENDIYLLNNIGNLFEEMLQASESCADTQTKMAELDTYLKTQIFRGGYILELDYSINCAVDSETINLDVDLTLKSEKTETTTSFQLSKMDPTTLLLNLLDEIENLFESDFQASESCSDTQTKMAELENYLNTNTFEGGYVSDLVYSVDCPGDNIDLDVTFTLKNDETELTSSFQLSKINPQTLLLSDLLDEIENLFESDFQASQSCADTQTKMADLETYLNTNPFEGGYVSDLVYSVDCSGDNINLDVTFTLKNDEAELTSSFQLSKINPQL